uniref:Uncharacterized protein n=1 Tax=Arundo donax TaxID=35708 RepID=A0A0A8ZCS3_ARUDO
MASCRQSTAWCRGGWRRRGAGGWRSGLVRW